MTSTYRTLLTLVLCSAGGTGACGDGDDHPLVKLTQDASSVEGPDAAEDEEDASPPDPGDPTPLDAGEPDADEELDADATDGGEETDASDIDADEADADTDGSEPDADVDAGEGDAAVEPDANTGGHPLAGHYAARTVLYMRQQVDLGGAPFDLVSKAALLSTIDIDAQGELREHYCFLEIVPEEGISSWIKPAAASLIPDTVAALAPLASGYARAPETDRTYVSWSPANQPADCTPGTTHASGCRCYAPEGVPSEPDDCRVRDLDSDGIPGVALEIDLSRPRDPAGVTGVTTLQIAATKSIGWLLPATGGERLVGTIEGGIDQAELSRTGPYASEFGAISNSVCPAASGHVELVRGSYDCAAILASRAADLEEENEADDAASEGLFNAQLDGTPPAVDDCPAPGTGCDGTLDACGVCNGPGIPEGNCDCDGHVLDACGRCDGPGIAAGTCDCEGTPAPLWYADTDGDGLGEPATSVRACTAPSGHVSNADDTDVGCSGTRDACGVCDGPGIPDGACDCEGAGPARWYEDEDGDGLGDPAITVEQCTQPTGFVANANDTDPGCAGTRDACGVCGGGGVPGGQCDCEGHTTDACGVCDGPGIPDGACDCDGTAPARWYEDADADGLGDPAIPVEQCSQPSGFVANADDTDPGCAGPRDTCGVCGGSGVPSGECDCEGTLPDRCGVCGGDGTSCLDCEGVVNGPKRVDACGVCGGNGSTCAGCDGVPGSGKVRDACGVCDGPGIPAGACNCEGALPATWYADLDGDGLGDPGAPTTACAQPAGHVANAGDADPSCAGARDVCGVCGGSGFPAGTCSCSGTAPARWYRDADGDGLGDPADSTAACTRPTGYVDNPNDTDPTCGRTRDECGVCGGSGIPAGRCNCDGAVLDACNVCGGSGIPEGACDCSGRAPARWYGDADGDGLGDPAVSQTACSAPAGYVATATDTDPTCGSRRDACGTCGGSATGTCPLLGSYAVRTLVFSKQRDGSDILTSKSIGYSLVTIAQKADRSLELSERGCWTQSLPRPGDATQAYSWSRPAWVQALPLSVQTLTANGNGSSYTRSIPLTHLGWDPARQPASCSTSSTPRSPWGSGWGATCRCNTPADALPPYDTNAAPYDCRLTDVDGDGQPGMSAIAATSAPSSPDANAPTFGGTAFAAVNSRGSWVITPGSGGRHTATVEDLAEAQVVGCTGLACSFLPSTPPGNRSCPQAVNRAQFVPTTASSDTCAEIIAGRDALFDASQDPAWPDNSACPPP